MTRPTSRLAIASFVAGLAAVLFAIDAYTHTALQPAFTAAIVAGLALPLGALGLARVATGERRGLRFALPGMALGVLITAPAFWLLTLSWG